MNYLDSFELTVLSSLIGSAIALLILTAKKVLKNKLSCTFHYYIWLILIIKLLLPLGPNYHINIFNIYGKSYVQNIAYKNTNEMLTNSSGQPQNSIINNSASANSHNFLRKNIIKINIPRNNKTNIKKFLSLIWLLGISILLISLVIGYKKLNEIIKNSSKNTKYCHNRILYDCINSMNIKTKIELLYSSQIGSPSICGILKPKILIPMNIANNACDEEFRHIIMHELFHLKNKDIIINWLIALLWAIYWFNPILLYAFHKIKQDCEISCDYQVISHLNKGDNIKYGNTIIKMLELSGDNQRLAGTTPMLTNSSEIKRRLIMIAKYKKVSIKNILIGSIIVAVIGGLSITVNTSNIRAYKNNSKVIKMQVKPLRVTNQSVINNSSTKNLLTDIKSLQANNINSTTPFSSDIVIYNSHPDENYKSASNIKVTDVAALINNKLVKNNLNSKFIKCPLPKDYCKSYENSRELITKNVKNYQNTVLLDLHRDSGNKANANTINFVLARKSPYYEKNLKFVNCISDYIKHSSKVKTAIYYYNYGVLYYNQDLSNKSVLVEIGNDWSNDKDIEDCVNAFASALRSIEANN